MNINEMDLEQLREHATAQAERLSAYEQREQELNGKITELTDLNQNLQRRNNTLLLKIDQQQPTPTPAPAAPATVESCEDFARRIIKGDNK